MFTVFVWTKSTGQCTNEFVWTHFLCHIYNYWSGRRFLWDNRRKSRSPAGPRTPCIRSGRVHTYNLISYCSTYETNLLALNRKSL